MKKLSDYKGDEAIELWADMLMPITRIITDKKIQKVYKTKSRMEVAAEILKLHAKDTTDILLRIDPTPLNGLNTIVRIVELIVDFEKADELKSFFGSAGQAQTASESSGLHTANIEAGEN